MRVHRGVPKSIIILPEKDIPRGKVLMPLRPSQWREPSARRSIYGPENEVTHRLTGRLNDGHIVWRGFFKDREDADEFLLALITGSLRYERELWRLPTPWWDIDFGDLTYDFSTINFVVSTSSGNQNSFTVPADFTGTNTLELIGTGAGATSPVNSVVNSNSGGGGGAYALISNISNGTFVVGATPIFFLNSGGVATAGPDVWMRIDGNSTAPTTAAQGALAKGGAVGGTSGSGTNVAGGLGGAAASCVGTVTHSGGQGGNGWVAPGPGGGAAGPQGDGGAGGLYPSSRGLPNGGSGGGGAGGSAAHTAHAGFAGTTGGDSNSTGGVGGGNSDSTGGGTAGTSVDGGDGSDGGGGGGGGGSGHKGGAGGPGKDWDATHGAGGGGGAGGAASGSGGAGGAAGLYGAGGGGGGYAGGSGSGASAGGAQGILVFTYTPVVFKPYQPTYQLGPVQAQ